MRLLRAAVAGKLSAESTEMKTATGKRGLSGREIEGDGHGTCPSPIRVPDININNDSKGDD